jgi:hypothetical protein
LSFAFFLAVPNVGAETTIKDLNFAVIEGFDDAFSVEFLDLSLEECKKAVAGKLKPKSKPKKKKVIKK